jgi:antimicrobial peptide system SdpA family protein
MLVTLFYSLAIFISVISMMYYFIESNPVKYRFETGSILYSFVPQGWAFFTRDPREAQIAMYQKNDDGNYHLLDTRNASGKFYFGLDRRAAKVMAELQYAKRHIPMQNYVDSTFNYQTEAIFTNTNTLPHYNFENVLHAPSLCGEYVIVFQKSLPWSWISNLENIKMPAQIVKVKFQCP